MDRKLHIPLMLYSFCPRVIDRSTKERVINHSGTSWKMYQATGTEGVYIEVGLLFWCIYQRSTNAKCGQCTVCVIKSHLIFMTVNNKNIFENVLWFSIFSILIFTFSGFSGFTVFPWQCHLQISQETRRKF